jgi:hypothetical protein
MMAAAVMEAPMVMVRIVMDAPMAMTPAISMTHHRLYSALLIREANLWSDAREKVQVGVQVACVKKRGVRNRSKFQYTVRGCSAAVYKKIRSKSLAGPFFGLRTVNGF